MTESPLRPLPSVTILPITGYVRDAPLYRIVIKKPEAFGLKKP